MSSNASKEWSGTKKDLQHKIEKMEKAIKAMITQHKERDKTETGIDWPDMCITISPKLAVSEGK